MRVYFAREDRLTDNQEGKVDPRYLAEVERMTDARSAAHTRREVAAARVVEAQDRVAELKARKATRSEIRAAWKAIRAREAELVAIEHLMHSAPGASTAHRGTKSTYNTADRDAVRREPDAPRERLTDGKRHPVTVARTSDSRGRMRP